MKAICNYYRNCKNFECIHHKEHKSFGRKKIGESCLIEGNCIVDNVAIVVKCVNINKVKNIL